MSKYQISWTDAGNCDIHGFIVEANTALGALERAGYVVAKNDLILWNTIVREATKVIVEKLP